MGPRTLPTPSAHAAASPPLHCTALRAQLRLSRLSRTTTANSPLPLAPTTSTAAPDQEPASPCWATLPTQNPSGGGQGAQPTLPSSTSTEQQHPGAGPPQLDGAAAAAAVPSAQEQQEQQEEEAPNPFAASAEAAAGSDSAAAAAAVLVATASSAASGAAGLSSMDDRGAGEGLPPSPLALAAAPRVQRINPWAPLPGPCLSASLAVWQHVEAVKAQAAASLQALDSLRTRAPAVVAGGAAGGGPSPSFSGGAAAAD